MKEELNLYLELLQKLQFLYDKSFNLSIRTSGSNDISFKEENAKNIFARIVLLTIAILRILPRSKYFYDKSLEFWDISSPAILIRGLVESYLVFYYLCIDNISKEESEFRYKLWVYHSEKEREEMLKTIKPMEKA